MALEDIYQSGVNITAGILPAQLSLILLLNFATGVLHLAIWNHYGSQGNLNLFTHHK